MHVHIQTHSCVTSMHREQFWSCMWLSSQHSWFYYNKKMCWIELKVLWCNPNMLLTYFAFSSWCPTAFSPQAVSVWQNSSRGTCDICVYCICMPVLNVRSNWDSDRKAIWNMYVSHRCITQLASIWLKSMVISSTFFHLQLNNCGCGFTFMSEAAFHMRNIEQKKITSGLELKSN